jgi:hypothetical protein
MRIIVWPDRGHAKPWKPRAQRQRGYRAGELVSYKGEEWVCVNTHHNPVFEPGTNSVPLWCKVLR